MEITLMPAEGLFLLADSLHEIKNAQKLISGNVCFPAHD